MSLKKEFIGTWVEVMASIPAPSSPLPAEGGITTVTTVNSPPVPADDFFKWLGQLPTDELDGTIKTFLDEWNISLTQDVKTLASTSASAGVMEGASTEHSQLLETDSEST